MENRRGCVVLRRQYRLAFAGHGPGGQPAAAEIVSSQGGDAGIAPSTGLARGCRRWGGTRFRGLCRAGVFARRLGLAASQGFRDDAGIVPCECRVWSCCTLKDTHAAKRQCTPQSASPPAPLTGEPSQTAAARKASPARGGGCAARRRRRGAAPRPANILPGRRILSAAAALRRAGSCCTLKDTHAAKRQCTPQAASPAITGLRSPHHAAHAEACLHSATAALPRSGKDRSGERRAILCFLSPNRR